MKKYLFTIVLVLGLTQAAFAGQMKKDSKGSYYVKDNGSRATSEWVTMDSDSDGKEEYYYFDAKGYLTTSGKTADGYDVNSKGQWIKDGKVQLKEKSTTKKDASNGNIISDTVGAVTDAYGKSIDAGQKAVEAGVDAAEKIVDNTMDAVNNMYGGLFSNEVNEAKDAYKDAVKDVKKAYSDALDEYKSEYGNAMKDYSNQISDMFKGFGF